MTKACKSHRGWSRSVSPVSGRCVYTYPGYIRKPSKKNPKHGVLLKRCKPGYLRRRRSPRICHSPARRARKSKSRSPPATTPHAKATAIAHRVENIVKKETTVAKAHKVAQQVKKVIEPSLRRSARLAKK